MSSQMAAKFERGEFLVTSELTSQRYRSRVIVRQG